MKAAFMGTPDFARIVLAGLLTAGWQVPVVVTQPDQPAGRGQRRQSSPVAALAAEHDLLTLKPAKASEAARYLRDSGAEITVVAAYGQILPAAVLRAAPGGAVNVHASLLPRYRGAAPIQQAILDGVRRTGVTLMEMDEGLDTGPIISFARSAIRPDDTAESLSERLAELGTLLLITTLPSYLAGETVARPQPTAGTSMTRRLGKADGRIDWTKPAAEIERQVRAMQPWPRAWTKADGKNLAILATRPTKTTLAVGEFDEHGRVGTGPGGLELLRVQPEGKQPMPAADWLRGYRGPRQFS